MISNFFPRLLTPVIHEALADTPVVCVLGPRQCGKTTLVRQIAPDHAFISLDEDNYYRTASSDPNGFVANLSGAVILDEIQRVPTLFPAIKLAVDQNRKSGRFLLTGSANLLLLPSVTESLAGRMEITQLHPLTEAEKEGRAGGFVSALLKGDFQPGIGNRDSPAGSTLAQRMVAGGYPVALTRSPVRARQWHRQYLQSIIERDVRDVARVRDARELLRLLELLALRNGEIFNASRAAGDLGLRRETVERYLGVLERLYLVRRLPAWRRNPAKRLVSSPKAYLIDSGVAAVLADLKAEDWLHNRNRMGHLLEAWVVQQLAAQAAWTDPDVRLWHYRDKDQVEVDVVLTRGERTWGIEVKASATLTSKDGQGLARLAERCGADFEQGILLYDGRDVLPMRDKRLLAVPLSELWDR